VGAEVVEAVGEIIERAASPVTAAAPGKERPASPVTAAACKEALAGSARRERPKSRTRTRSVGADEHVVGLEVAMDDPDVVGRLRGRWPAWMYMARTSRQPRPWGAVGR
jgi:hypothetical protein